LARREVGFAAAAVGFAVVTLITVLIGHPLMFSRFAVYDDEGYMLTALKSFIQHGSLYDDVFSQYGPFYYEAWGGLFSIFGIAVSHDAGRTTTLVVWVATSLGLGLATWRLTASALLGLATQMLVFTALVVLTNEPMHPGGIICLLLAAIVAISCFVGPRLSIVAMALLGAAVAALVLVKINVGAFALAAVVLACVASYPVLGGRRWLRLIVEVGYVAIPLAIIASRLDEAWARHYAVHVTVAALALVFALRARKPGQRPAEELLWLAGSLIVTGLVICLALIGTGTSPAGLVEGIVRQPLHQADAFTIPLQLSNRGFPLDAAALLAAGAYLLSVRRGFARRAGSWWPALVSALSILIGIEMALSLVGRALFIDPSVFNGYQQSMLAFAWVALIGGPDEERSPVAFARLLLPALAVLQGLHAFPVAGSQSLWATFLLIPVGAICVGNGVHGLVRSLPGVPVRPLRLALAAGSLALAIFLVNVTLRQPLDQARGAYDALVPIDLPGTSVRVGQPEAALYREVSGAIDEHCAAVVMLPGMDSFYLWSRQEPPTGFNPTAWPTLFDEAHESRIIEETRSIPDLCLLEYRELAEGWSGGKLPDGPLLRYYRDGFEPLRTFAPYVLKLRAEPTGG
jgi:hypothetical protein